MFYKDYHSSIDQLRGGDGEGGLQVISALPTGFPELVPRQALPTEIESIPDLFGMPGFPEYAKAEWRKIVDGDVPHVLVPDNYFDWTQIRYEGAAQNYQVRLPPVGFEITQEGGYQSESSTVCKIYICALKFISIQLRCAPACRSLP
jgi:hypothetical protein